MPYGTQYDIFNDLTDLEQMVRALPNYLRGNQLYGSIGGGFFTGGNAPSLTVGAILLRMRRIEALTAHLSDRTRQSFATTKTEHQAIYTKQSTLYQQWMLREASSRLDAMTTFFEECRQSGENCPRIYPPEVLRRTIVQEICNALTEFGVQSAELTTKANGIDRRLRGMLRPTAFVWDAQLEPVYPATSFWWMYMAPPDNRRD
ncbi:MAG: hypothetical protein ACOYL5_07385 [Phototrophicaceae bacterium]|jgi:hypothetical protein